VADIADVQSRNSAITAIPKRALLHLESNSDLGQPELSFVQHLHQFNTHDDAARIVELLESQHRLHPPLDSAMILLSDVIQVLT
jgi:hypothetical protein